MADTIKSLPPVTDPLDIAYIKAHFRLLAETPTHLPQPSYVLADGSRYVPLDYFEQETDRDRFLARYIAKARELQIEDAERSAPEQWEAFQ
ncbi:MAG TPA: hypothetical protein VEJ41_04970, partial [Candidatus Acidoferrales bacterium]|nr:hypothetical protein [Candidatus Acidoferrales bacterium]